MCLSDPAWAGQMQSGITAFHTQFISSLISDGVLGGVMLTNPYAYAGWVCECHAFKFKAKLSAILPGYVFTQRHQSGTYDPLHDIPFKLLDLLICTHTQIQSVRYVVFSSLPRLNHSFHVQESFFLAPSLCSTHHWMATINAAYTQFWSVHFLKDHFR